MNTIKLDTSVTFLQAAEGEAAASPRRFTIEAYTGSQIRQGWSREPVVIDLAGMAFKQKIPIVLGHDYSLGSVLGQTDSVRVEAGKLIVEGEILADTDTARQVLALAQRGYAWQASVGADVRRHQRVEADAVATVNGQSHVGPVRIVKASSLREVSFVTLGADAETSVAIAAEAAEEQPMAADATQKPTDEVVETAVVAATAEVAVVPEPEIKVEASKSDELNATIATLNDKVSKMEKLLATRDERPAAPAVHVVADVAPTADVIQAAFALQGGLPQVEKHFDAKTLEAAHKVQRTTSLGEVLLAAAEAKGYDGPRRVTSATLRPILEAAWATHSVSGILSNTANKFLLAGFNSVESAWRSIASVRSVNDFKTLTSYRLNGGFKFEKMANGGEFKNAAASEDSRTISAETYGIMTSATRTDLINDDLGAFTAIPQRIGRGGALKLNDVFWTEFQADHGNWYTSGRGNLVSSAGALSIANLKKLVTAFRKLKDPDGNPVAVDPRVLLVPADLELDAAEIMGSALIQSGATTGQPDRNVLAGRYQVVGTTYLTSADDYYLMASPADLPAMEVAFLNGVQSPIVETAEADFNVLGVQMRGYFDFGVAKAEYLAGVKGDKA
jgi:HK97 family phage prohead protease